ncbi:MAG: pilin [bacterium]
MTNIFKKVFFLFFNIRFLKICFIFITVIILHLQLALFIPVFAAGTSSQTYVDPSVEPCSLYRQLNWGYTGDKKGLYQDGSVGKDVAKLYSINEDPLYLSTSYKATDALHPNPLLQENAVLGYKKGSGIVEDSVLVPCVSGGGIKGILPRSNQGSAILNAMNYSNCDYAISGNYNSSLLSLCTEDAKLGGKTASGCVLNFEYRQDVTPYVANYIGNYKNSGDVNTAREQGAVLRVLYEPGSFINKTKAPTDDNLKLIYKDMQKSVGVFFDKYVSTNYGGKSKDYRSFYYKSSFDFKIVSSDISQEAKDDVEATVLKKDYYYLGGVQYGISTDAYGTSFYLPQNLPGALGVWNNIGADGNDSKNQRYKVGNNTSDVANLIADAAQMQNMFKGFYMVNNGQMAKDWENTVFECHTRAVPVINTTTGKTLFNVKLYEWLPSLLTKKLSPSCESVSNSDQTPRTITIPSSVNGAPEVLVCTPCIVAKIFQTDLFGQPVYGIPTGIGCLPSSMSGLITVLVRIASMTAGGIAVLIITISGIKIALNAGNPDEVRKAQKSISSAVTGMLVIIASVLLLNLVGVRILDLSSFGGNSITFVSTSK